jgi:hypothetical protein
VGTHRIDEGVSVDLVVLQFRVGVTQSLELRHDPMKMKAVRMSALMR